jgi:pyruvate dehydrogenase E2 component (dihydrolipoamide acetyltransferase)
VAEVQLPQLGESVTEGVITSWLVEVGDHVDVDQAIVEISTDKVDTEIPTPVAGTVTELRFDVDDTVEVGQVLAVIDETADTDATSTDGEPDDSETTNGDSAPDDAESDPGDGTPDDAESDPGDGTPDDAESDPGDGTPDDATPDADDANEDSAPETRGTGDASGGEDTSPTEAAPRPGAARSTDGGASADGQARDAGTAALASPLVRKMLREAGVEPGSVRGTGKGGRITREDAERAIAEGPAPAAEAPGRAAPAQRERPPASPLQVEFGGEREVTQDLSRIRKAVGRAMMKSLHNTAQLTAAVEVDMTSIMSLREAVKEDFKQREGASLTPLALIARAVCMTLPRHPGLNAAMDQDAETATFHRYVNLGIAVDTERGLLVPNIKDAQDLGVAGIARAIGDLAARTRGNKLGPDDIQGGTFTITNTGSMGTLFDTPILNPPEVAILATPLIEKRPVVISGALGDSIAIRWMTYLCLTYDHRMVDGADAARFLQDLKFILEEHDFASELGR